MRNYNLMHHNTPICKGGIYELQNQNTGETNGQLYCVISNNDFQVQGNTALICMVKAKSECRFDSKYEVPFIMKQIDLYTDMVILPDTMFITKASRLTKYKFTLTDDVMDKVAKMAMLIISGKELYTMDEAIVELHNREVTQRIEYEATLKTGITPNVPVVEAEPEYDIELDDENLSTEDAQNLFAKSMKNEKFDFNAQEIKSQKVVDKVEKKEEESDNIDDVINTPKDTAPKKKPRRHTGNKNTKTNKNSTVLTKDIKDVYQRVYDNYEEFLMDYYTSPIERLLTKWNLTDKRMASNRAVQCRIISKRNGDDQSIWDDAQKSLINDGHKRAIMKIKDIKAKKKKADVISITNHDQKVSMYN